MVLYRAPWYFYASATITLFLECVIIHGAPFIIWAMNVHWKAGDTLMSEYSVVIGLRWCVVLLFQLPLFMSCLCQG